MSVKILIRFAGALCLVAGIVGGCECQRETAQNDEPPIGTAPLSEVHPDVRPPEVDFPQRWRSRDPSLNAFIEQALDICARGNYDGFRALFGTAFPPPDQSNFERVWKAVRGIRVTGLYRGHGNPPDYYLHAVIEYREEDRKGRTERDVVVMLFREADQWRLGQAPPEIIRDVRRISTRPAASTQPASTTRPTGEGIRLDGDG